VSLRSSGIFYGWWIVAASFLIAMGGGVVFYGFTAFFEPIADDMGWSYTQISLAASLQSLGVGLLAPFAGMLVDRWGSRRLIFGGAVITAGGLILLSHATSLGMFYGAFVLIAIGMSACAMTVLMTAVANWFHRKIGIASGIAMCGLGFSGLVVPVIVKLIEMYEWRMTVTILALGMLVVVLPPSLLFRRKPEQYGLFPDGESESFTTYRGGSGVPQALEVEVKAKPAIMSGAFWRLASAFLYHMMAVSAVVTHVMPYLSSVGISRAISSLVASAVPMVSIGGRLVLGWLADKFDKRLVAAGSFAMMGCGVLFFGYTSATSTWMLVPFFILFGIGFGGSKPLRASLTREYFGRITFGVIFGLMTGIGGIGGLIGPIITGWAYDNWGSYQVAWFLLAGLAVVPLLSVLTITPVKNVIQPGDDVKPRG